VKSFVVLLLLLYHASAAIAQGGPLQPGDVVRLSVSREEGMSGDYPVDETGHAALPLIGMRLVTNVPVDQARRDILAAYEEQLRNQTIQVVFLRRVRVLGEVNKPGLYHVDPTMTLGDAIALAGGPTPEASDDVQIYRAGTEIHADITRPAMQQVESGDHIVVQDRGWWTRNARYVFGFATPLVVLAIREAIRE
jgi:polysaccharide export outer membrane protein